LLAILAKSIAIAIAILGGKSIAILTAIRFFPNQYCNTFAILHYLLFRINFDFCHCAQFLKFGLTTNNLVNPGFKR